MKNSKPATLLYYVEIGGPTKDTAADETSVELF